MGITSSAKELEKREDNKTSIVSNDIRRVFARFFIPQ
jgi:hypothetical protein